jgi:hypothetical protein
MTLSAEIRPSRGIGLFVAGGVLLLLAVVGIVLYAFGIPDQAADGSSLGVLRGVTVVGAGIAAGVGALLIVLGVVKRTSRAARGD